MPVNSHPEVFYTFTLQFELRYLTREKKSIHFIIADYLCFQCI